MKQLMFIVLMFFLTINQISFGQTESKTKSGPSEVKQLINKGESAIRAGDLDTAYEIFTGLLKEYPGSEKLNFVLGLTCYARSDYSRARLAFDRVLQINPENDSARLHLARVYLVTGDIISSKREFMTVLSHNPPENVKSNIQYYLDMIESKTKRWNFAGRMGAGYFRDDNVNVGPDSDIVRIAPITSPIGILTEMNAQKPVESGGLFGIVSLSESYDPGETGYWVLAGAGSYYKNKLDSESSVYENMFWQGMLGPKYVTSKDFINFPVIMGHITSGGNPLVDMYGLSPSYMHASGNAGIWQYLTSAQMELRDYKELDDRDGSYVALSESVIRIFESSATQLSIGASLFHNAADEAVYTYTGGALETGGEWRWCQSSKLYENVRYTKTMYDEKELLAPEKRSDDQWQFVVGINKAFGPWIGLDINHQITENQSTFGLYQYNRNVTTISMVIAF